MDATATDIIMLLGTTISAFIASFFGYKKLVKKTDGDFQQVLLNDVNSQNAELRKYLSDELKESVEKYKKTTNELENKIQSKENEITNLKIEKEKLQILLVKIRIMLLKNGLDEVVKEIDNLT